MSSIWIIFAVFIQLFLISNAQQYAGCEFTEDCADSAHTDPACFPYKVNNTTPKVQNWTTHPPVCSEYIDKPSCCNDAANTAMYNQFSIMISTFGHDNGGCDVCVANLIRFWCKYTCDPDQRKYVQVGLPANVTNPQTGKPTLAVPLNFTVTDDLACGIFTSCRKTNFISQLSQTQTSHGFFTFLGENSVTQSNNYITMFFSQDGLSFDTHSCNQSFPSGKDDLGYPVNQSCDCNNCQDACAILPALQMPGLFKSVNWNILLIVYVILAAEVLIFFLLKRKRKSEKEVKISESEDALLHKRGSDIYNNSGLYAVDSERSVKDEST